MGNIFSLRFPAYQPYDDNDSIKKHMEKLAKSYCKKVKANWNKTMALEVSNDEDIIPLLQAAPVNELEILIIHGIKLEEREKEDCLSLQGVSNLTLVIEHNKTIKGFGFIRNHIDMDKATILCHSLCHLPAIEIISFWDNQIDSKTADYIIDIVKRIPTLKELNLGANLFIDGPEKEERLRNEGYQFRLRFSN
jgi:hypothetical protein